MKIDKTHPQYKYYWAVIGFVVLTLIGLLGPLVFQKALGAEAEVGGVETVRMTKQCPSSEFTCSVTHNRKAFARGRLGHNQGVRGWARNPRVAKAVMVNKLNRAISRANRERAARGLGPMRLAGGCTTGACAYQQMIGGTSTSCMGSGGYPAWATQPGTCKKYADAPPPGGPMTKEQIQKFGTAGLCGAGVAIMYIYRPAALAGPPVYWMTGTSAASCFWGAWRDLG